MLHEDESEVRESRKGSCKGSQVKKSSISPETAAKSRRTARVEAPQTKQKGVQTTSREKNQ